MKESLFPSFFIGGFECSTHRRRDGRRLDMSAEADDERFDRTEWAVLDEVARHIDEVTARSRA